MLVKNDKVQFEFVEIKYLTEEIFDATSCIYDSLAKIARVIEQYEDPNSLEYHIRQHRISSVLKDINNSLRRINRAAGQITPNEEEN